MKNNINLCWECDLKGDIIKFKFAIFDGCIWGLSFNDNNYDVIFCCCKFPIFHKVKYFLKKGWRGKRLLLYYKDGASCEYIESLIFDALEKIKI